MFRTIRLRIAVPFVLLIVLSVLGTGAYLGNLFRQRSIDNLQASLSSTARLLAASLDSATFREAHAELLDRRAKEWAQALDVRVTLIAADGTVLGESDQDRSLMENHGDRPEVIQALAAGQGSSIRFSETLGFDTLYTATALLHNGAPVGVVRLSVPLREVNANLAAMRNATIAVSLLVAVLAVLIAILIANRTTRPLRELTESTRKIAGGTLTDRLRLTTQDEVGDLARAFNHMSDQLVRQISALETERSKLEAILEQMNSGVIIVDQEGNVNLMNGTAEKLFDVPSTAVGRSLVEISRDHNVVELWDMARETRRAQVLTLERPQQRDHLQVVAIPLGGTLAGLSLLHFQDMTRMRRLERVRRDFISNISHELRTPLASLKALTETLVNGALEDPPAARRFLTRIETEVDALTLMVQELLELARIESGSVPLERHTVSPCKLIREASERLHLQAERGGLNIIVDCEDHLPEVLADPPRIEQVILNLLHNAIKFTPSDGQVMISAWQNMQTIVFKISDTGVGIPADDLPRIFERFYKADRARSGGGTGLGLAIAKHLVELHEGAIWAESTPGRGSSFFFTLPVA